MSELEQSVADVNQAESSAPQTETESSVSSAPVQEQAAKEPQYVPYERFKEINEAKNEFQKRLEAQERQLRDFQSRFEQSSQSKAVSKEQALLERLKGIDPEFGSWAEKQEAAAKELAELKEWRAQAQREQQINVAKSTVEKLQSELKVDASLHSLYLNNIQMGSPEQIAARYKELHTNTMKYIDSVTRSGLAEYGQSKKQDASAPTPAKVAAVKSAPAKREYPSDPEELRSQIIKNAIKGARSVQD